MFYAVELVVRSFESPEQPPVVALESIESIFLYHDFGYQIRVLVDLSLGFVDNFGCGASVSPCLLSPTT